MKKQRPCGRRSSELKHPSRGKAIGTIEPLEQRLLLSANVLGYHNDQFSSGANLQETILTPANVNASGFGKLNSTPVDGQVYAQPLYVSGLNVTAGSQPGTHNVVFVATEHDSLYAIDAQSGSVLWQDSFLVPEAGLVGGGNSVAVTTVPYTEVNTTDLQPEIGITSTPAIDLNSGYLFLTAKAKQVVNGDTADPHYVYMLYRVDISSGSFTGTLIADTTRNTSSGAYTYNSGPFVYDNLDPNHKGAGVVNNNGQYVINFNALRQLNRAAVTLYNGNVYLAFASHGDNTPYHGWILGYSESSLAPTAVFNDNPDGNDDGIWQAGGRIAIDSQGFMYVQTGNGAFDTTLDANGFPQYGDYGDSFIKIGLDPSTTSAKQNVNGWGLKVVDYFTPQNQAALSSADQDLGSGGPMILPETVGSVTIGNSTHPDLLVGAGKQGMVYLIDRNNMGHYSATTDNVVQELSGALPQAGSYDTPAFYYDGTTARFYYVAASSSARSFTISGASFALSSVSADPYGSRDATTSISANGSTNGTAWNIDPGTGQLRAYDAGNYANELWTSGQAPNARDTLGTALKFTTPTVADGQVFVGTSNALVIYGVLVPPTQPPAAPSNLAAAAVSGVQINLSWQDNSNDEAGFYIYVSTDGGNTWGSGPVATANVNATSYTVGGLQPGTAYTFRVQAFNVVGDSGFSNTASATTISQPPALNFSNGFANAAAILQLNGAAAKIVGSSLQLTDGGGNEATSAFSTSAFPLDRFNTNFTFKLTNPNADGFTFTLQGAGPTAVGGAGGSLGYAGSPGITPSVCVKFDLYSNNGEGNDSTGLFTDGASPYGGSTSFNMTASGVNLHSGDIMAVTLAYDGTNLHETVTDTATNAIFSHTYTINIPGTIGATSGYVGFTAGTGGQTATQDVLTWTYTPLPAPPATPSSFTVTPASGSELDLAWNETSTPIDHFDVLRQASSGSYVLIGQVPGNATTYPDTALTQNTTYSYELIASNAGGDSAPAGPVSGTTPYPPAAPTNLQATQITSTSVALNWQDNAPNASGYKIVRQKESDSSQYVTTLGPGAAAYTDTTLQPGTAYEYIIAAYNLAGPSMGAVVNFETIAAAPAGLTATASETGNTNQIALNWTAPKGAESYNVYRGTSSGGEVQIATGIAQPTFTDSNVPLGTTYYYQVTTVDGSGEGAPSSEVSATANLLDTITGGSGADNINLSPDPDGILIDWSVSGSVASLAYKIPINDPAGLTLNGNGGMDQITLASGNSLPAVLHLNGNFTINNLQSLNGTVLDLGRSTVYVNYAGASDPLAMLQTALSTGYAHGAWNGTSTATAGVITTATGTANFGIGYADSADSTGVNTTPNSIELKYTVFGDANLDGKVDLADFLLLTRHFGTVGGWDTGDFNYDDTIALADLLSLTRHFGQTAPPPISSTAMLSPTPFAGTRRRIAG